MSHSPDRTSHILQQIIASSSEEGTISIGEFTNLLGDRAFCLTILIFSLPNSLPVPGIPGFSTITGLPILFIALQMLAGRETIWLPSNLAAKRFSRKGMGLLLSKALPGVIWLEKYLMPRWFFIADKLGERGLGLLFILLALIIALPIPGGNFLPGLSMSLLALGMLERDGMFLTGALVFSIASFIFMVIIIALFFHGMISGITMLF